jgi:hypothetical protein
MSTPKRPGPETPSYPARLIGGRLVTLILVLWLMLMIGIMVTKLAGMW